MEKLIERVLSASRWLPAPISIGLSFSLPTLPIKFFQELIHLAPLPPSMLNKLTHYRE